MKKKKYDISSLDGLTELFNDAVKEMAYEALYEIENMYETAIEKFYDDYTPIYYNRTGYTMYASSGYPQFNNLFDPHNISEQGSNMWNARITIDSSYIPGNPYRADKHWVYKRTFLRGIHGISQSQYFGKKKDKVYSRGTGKDRYRSLVKTKRGYIIKRNGINSFYNEGFVSSVMNNMSPTPSGVMNRQFKEFRKKRNMKAMFNRIFLSKFD